jgi:FkbM family methyltransferase
VSPGCAHTPVRLLDRIILGVDDEPRDFFIRVGTTDARLVGQVFTDQAFDLKKLRRFYELQALLSAGRGMGRRPLIIDAGANIGASSVFFAAQCPDALIVALEPEVANYQLLVANTVGLSVLPLPCALAAESGQCLLQDPGEGEWAYRTQVLEANSNDVGAISTLSVDDILDAHRNECFPFIVKIDVEGAESEIFSAAADWVEQVPLIIIEPHDWMLPRQRSAQPLFRRLALSDRDFVIIGENIFSMSIVHPMLASK